MLWHVLDAERTHRLRPDEHFVEAGVGRPLLDLAVDGLDEALFPSLQCRPLVILSGVVDTLQVRLLYVNLVWELAIHFHEELAGEGGHVHFLGEVELGQGTLIRNIESIGEVLEAHQDLVLVKREETIGAVGVEAYAQFFGESEELLVLFVGDALPERSLVIKGEIVLRWLLNI